MALSNPNTPQYSSSQFVESAGTILFNIKTQKICILHLPKSNHYVLAKGRRNIGESRAEAALRETLEETGHRARLLSVDMFTRCPPTVETGKTKDEPRFYEGVEGEPFYLQTRELGKNESKRTKIIWWFIAAVIDEEAEGKGEGTIEVGWWGYEDAVERILTFEGDREVVKSAVEILKATKIRQESL